MRIACTLLAAIAALAVNASEPAPALQGKWTNGTISSIQYVDAYTGVSRPPTGKYFAYEFRADGTYTFSGMVQSAMYNCTATMFGQESGNYTTTASGEVALQPLRNPFRMVNSCAASANREAAGKLQDRAYRFRIDGRRLELVRDGSVEVFQRER